MEEIKIEIMILDTIYLNRNTDINLLKRLITQGNCDDLYDFERSSDVNQYEGGREILDPKDNDGRATIKVYKDNDLIWDNNIKNGN